MSTEPHALLLLARGGELFRLGLYGATTHIGSGEHADVRLAFSEVTGQHCRITRHSKGHYFIEDSGSERGTYLTHGGGPEARVLGASALVSGDSIRLGSYHLHFAVPQRVDEGLGLLSLSSQKLARLGGPVCTVGRARAALVIADAMISARHATLDVIDERTLSVVDHASSAGTWVNDARIDDVHFLREGDVVAFGKHAYRVARAQAGSVLKGEARLIGPQALMDDREKQAVVPWRPPPPVLDTVAEMLPNKHARARLTPWIAGAVGAIALLGVLYPMQMRARLPCRVSAADAQAVKVSRPGRVDKVYVKEGDDVPAGKLLLHLVDERAREAKLRADKELAAIREAIAQLSAKDKKRKLAALNIRKKRAERNVERARALPGESEVRAESAGRVVSIAKEDANVRAGDPVAQLAEASGTVLEIALPSGHGVRPGQRLEVSVLGEVRSVEVRESSPTGATIALPGAVIGAPCEVAIDAGRRPAILRLLD